MATAAEPFQDTIFALSSGRLPAAIAVMRVSGPASDAVLKTMVGNLPPPRRASLRTVRDDRGEPIDRALVLRFPGPDTATGEDIAEFHLHGSRAVVAAASRAFAALGCREAEPGEFTRRALLAGRMDLVEAEALADLLEAETETQRRDALRRATGGGRLAREWAERLTTLAAVVEHHIDHDEDDGDPASVLAAIAAVRAALDTTLAAPSVGLIRDGIRVVLAGPPNAGKSSLFNRIVGSDAAIVSATPGTTRDLNERTIAIDGYAYVLVDTAGSRDTADQVEAEGVARARVAVDGADIVIDLGDDAASEAYRIEVAAQCDRVPPAAGRIATSARTGEGIPALLSAISTAGRRIAVPAEAVALDDRQRADLARARALLVAAETGADMSIVAEHIRAALQQALRMADFVATEVVLTALFSRFCVGK